MLAFLTSALGIVVVLFYFYMAVAFYRQADPAWSFVKAVGYALTWPASVWLSPGNPVGK